MWCYSSGNVWPQTLHYVDDCGIACLELRPVPRVETTCFEGVTCMACRASILDISTSSTESSLVFPTHCTNALQVVHDDDDIYRGGKVSGLAITTPPKSRCRVVVCFYVGSLFTCLWWQSSRASRTLASVEIVAMDGMWGVNLAVHDIAGQIT